MVIFLGSLTQPVIPWNTGWLRTRFPRQWIMIVPNTVYLTTERIINQQGFWTTLNWRFIKPFCQMPPKGDVQTNLPISNCLMFIKFIGSVRYIIFINPWDQLPFLGSQWISMNFQCACRFHSLLRMQSSRSSARSSPMEVLGARGTMGCCIIKISYRY